MENKLDQCTIILTRTCNLRCDFCFEKEAGYSIRDRISFENVKKVIDFCCDADMKYIFLTGGEPLTYPYLLDVLTYIKSKNTNIMPTIATNGILLKNFDFCKQLVDNGLGYVDISMKGIDSKTWSNATGYDGLKEQMEGIENISKLGIDFTCSMVVTLDNVMNVCDAVQLALGHGAKQFSFTFFIDNCESKFKDKEYLKRYNPFMLIESFISQIDRLNQITDDWWIEYSFPICTYTDKQLELLDGRLAAPCQIHTKNAITVNTDLRLLPCDMFLNLPLGTLSHDFNNYEEFKKYSTNKEYQAIMGKLRKMPSEQCVGCKYLDQCYGGCPVLWKNYSFDSMIQFKNEWINENK